MYLGGFFQGRAALYFFLDGNASSATKTNGKSGSVAPGRGLGLGVERESVSRAWPKI